MIAEGVRTGEIASIGLSTQMCATCPTSASGELLREMISWQDTRAGTEVDLITIAVGQERFKAVTGSALMPQLPIAKMLWLGTHEPELFVRTRSGRSSRRCCCAISVSTGCSSKSRGRVTTAFGMSRSCSGLPSR